MLTNKQNKVLETIKGYINEYGTAPSLTELQKELNISTKRGVVQYLESLEKKGLIQRLGSRSIKIVWNDNSGNFLNVPIVGYANCGQPLSYAEDTIIGKIQVDKKLIKSDRDIFIVIAKGDSMNQKEINGNKINDKDYVITAKNQYINNGDAVVAMIDNAATIKTYYKKENMIVLKPESDNPVHQPIFLSTENQATILGKVVGVLEGI